MAVPSPDVAASPSFVNCIAIVRATGTLARYAIHEFAKNVFNVKAYDSKGKQLAVTRPNPYQWDVAGHDGTVVFTYTIFGDRGDGTYLQIDESHAHLNMPATFVPSRWQIHHAPMAAPPSMMKHWTRSVQTTARKPPTTV